MSTNTLTARDGPLTDPVVKAINQNDQIKVIQGTDLLLAELTLHGHKFVVTYHAIQRFQERCDNQLIKMFPHLDFECISHVLFAMFHILESGDYGTFRNTKNDGIACEMWGWLFVVVPEDGAHKIVTCYPKHSSTRFYPDPSVLD